MGITGSCTSGTFESTKDCIYTCMLHFCTEVNLSSEMPVCIKNDKALN